MIRALRNWFIYAWFSVLATLGFGDIYSIAIAESGLAVFWVGAEVDVAGYTGRVIRKMAMGRIAVYFPRKK